ncbi:copper chaperone PCu(A)C [Sphingopyxis solisilvae]|uniref:copper chaperone PCu(A)C n=1 Tax=Sphingopyxis solisilvae TaxID=1886788 RepID=UPI001892A228|nr:copper chaperone PCu(A)C [Sphingopyxis solisilvae]
MKPFAFAALAATALTLSACGDNLGAAKPLNVVSGHVVMGATPDRPAVGYFRVQGGPQPVQLVAVTTDLAQRVEMHESLRENGVMTMKPITSADVPAKGELVFKQGGKHLMIWGINGAAVRAGKLPMAFVFTNNNNERILFDMVIKPAEGAAAGSEAAMDHDAMGHGEDKGEDKAAADAAKQ